MIAHFESKNEENWKGYIYSILLFLTLGHGPIVFAHHCCQLMEIGFCMRMSLTCMISKKTLRLSSRGKSDFSTGEIINLVSIDCQRISDQIDFIGCIWGIPLQLAIGMYLLYNELGVAALFGFLGALVLVPLNSILGFIATKQKVSQLDAKDARMKVNQIQLIQI